MNNWPAKWVGLIAGMLVGGVVAWAGITGSISGTVTDASGAVVPKAEVTAVEVNTNVTQMATTDNLGSYSFLALPVGEYKLEVKAAGFRTYQQTGISLKVNDALKIDVALQVGSAAQSVEVSASSQHVETISTQSGDVITGSKTTSLPLNGRNFTDLLGLQPGVMPISAGTVPGSGNFAGTETNGNVSISGQRESANGFMVNGGSVEEDRNNGTAIIPNLDSIAEFRVLTNAYDAEYGYFTGGIVNVVTKSGTNNWHGSAFEFLRNSDLDSRNFYDINRGVLQRNQFGGTFGGPIVRDKLFFFLDYQGTRQNQGLSSGQILDRKSVV